ncbi:hypothetical protein EYF80_056055 [Liparis tanakae]|uniref:Uncharacterized protein n=1 Tax=Liparis tanakae TaxID=230148 RepID=A0A4Z2EYW7_9TELE|nr:hypothetical protein EYF80_056055 [Liparis tanakae]
MFIMQCSILRYVKVCALPSARSSLVCVRSGSLPRWTPSWSCGRVPRPQKVILRVKCYRRKKKLRSNTLTKPYIDHIFLNPWLLLSSLSWCEGVASGYRIHADFMFTALKGFSLVQTHKLISSSSRQLFYV